MSSTSGYLYKIVDEQPPETLPETLPSSDLDQKDGFIHLSEGWRIPKTADLFFSKNPVLWILKLRTSGLDGKIEYPADLPGCAHVYESRNGLGKHNIEAVIRAEKADHSSWSDVAKIAELDEKAAAK